MENFEMPHHTRYLLSRLEWLKETYELISRYDMKRDRGRDRKLDDFILSMPNRNVVLKIVGKGIFSFYTDLIGSGYKDEADEALGIRKRELVLI